MTPSEKRNVGVAVLGATIALSIVSLGAGSYFGSLYSPANKQYPAIDAEEASSESYEGVTQSLPDIALIPDPVERAIANPPPNSGEDHEKRDLAAQESMAAWAFYMTLFAGLTALITFIGTILIWKQVSLTREAVKDTGDATDAMVRQNKIAQSAQRPWLEIISPKIVEIQEVLVDGEPRFGALKVEIRVKNYGVSPALFPTPHVLAYDGSKGVVMGEMRAKLFTTNAIGQTAVYPTQETDIGMSTVFPIEGGNGLPKGARMQIAVGVAYRQVDCGDTFRVSKWFFVGGDKGAGREGTRVFDLHEQTFFFHAT